MRNIRYITVAVCATFALASCNSDKETLINADKQVKDVEVMENGAILKFKDGETFNRFVESGTAVEGFYSLYDNFEDAMKEAESYYDREGGYEEFKAKYSSLYFPEYEDDYSAYLPVSDKDVAKFVNKEGDVIVGDENISFKNIKSYNDLIEAGYVPDPKEVRLKTREIGNSGYPLNGLDEIKYNKRKLWVNVDKKPCPDPTCRYYINIEVCFRKKGFLGAWYNYAESSTTLHQGPKKTKKSGFSSHDYRAPMNGMTTVEPFYAVLGVSFQGFGKDHGDDIFYFEVNKQ